MREIAEAHGWTVVARESDAGGARFEFAGVKRGGDESNRNAADRPQS